MIPAPIRARVDATLKARGVFSHEAIEDVLREEYKVGDDYPTVDDDEFHDMITELHAHYNPNGEAP